MLPRQPRNDCPRRLSSRGMLSKASLKMSASTATSAPIPLFETWLEEAGRSEPADPNAMALATVDASGLPNVRMVLLKGHGADGFVFYTNLDSIKGNELAS